MVSDGEMDSVVGGSSLKESKGIAELEKTSTSTEFVDALGDAFGAVSRTIWFVSLLNCGLRFGEAEETRNNRDGSEGRFGREPSSGMGLKLIASNSSLEITKRAVRGSQAKARISWVGL